MCLEDPAGAKRSAAKEDGLRLRPVCPLLWGAFLFFVVFPLSGRADLRTVTNEWLVKIGCPVDSSAAVAPDGSIYFGTWDGTLIALKSDGTRKWNFHAGREIRSSPALSPDGTVYFGCRDRKFYCLASDGKKRWEFKTKGWVDSSPAVGTDGTVYFGSWDKSLYALNSDGVVKWQYKTGGPVVSSPALGADGTVFFGSHDKIFYALSSDGQKKWEHITAGNFVSSPALDKDGTVYATSVDGFFYAFTAEGGLKWRLKTGGITESSPVIGPDGTLYVGVNNKLWAIAPDGKEKWEQEVVSTVDQPPIDATPAVLADNSVCIVSGYGVLSAINQQRQYSWYLFIEAHGPSSPAVGAKGSIYIGGSAYGYPFHSLTGGIPLAKSPWPKFRGNPENNGNRGFE